MKKPCLSIGFISQTEICSEKVSLQLLNVPFLESTYNSKLFLMYQQIQLMVKGNTLIFYVVYAIPSCN